MTNMTMGSSDENNDSVVLDEDSVGIEYITFIYPAPFLIILGLVANVFICLVLRKPHFRRICLFTFLFAYSISNILAVLLNSGIEWLSDIILGTHFYTYSDSVCRIWQFVIRIVTYSGGWFMVAMTIERFLCVWFPKRANGLCSVFFAKTIIAFIVLGLIIISAHALWLFRITKRGSEQWCYIDTYSTFYAHFWLVLGMQFSVVPLCLVLFFGMLACVGILRQSRGKPVLNEQMRMDVTFATMFNSFLYFILNTPATVINVIDNFSSREWLESSPIIDNLEIARDISQFLVLINYSSGITAWVLCSSAFRRAFKELLIRKPKPNRASVHSRSSCSIDSTEV